jgi:CRISPR/Cas system-associated exonuclease Cas4 (RecB family)
MKKVNISQSLIKSLHDYLGGKECGIVFKAKYFEGKNFPSSPVQKLGQWFEYISTGAKARGGLIPQPETTKGGDLTAPYERMKIHKGHLLNELEFYGFKIKHVGYKIAIKGLEGTIDLVCEATRDLEIINPESGSVEVSIAKGQIVFVDIKSSGLLDDRYNELGWDTETLPQKEKLMIQPVHYKYLGRLKFKQDIPFFFFIHSNTNDVDRKIIHTTIQEEKIEEHIAVLEKVKRMVKLLSKKGELDPKPEVKRCSKCPLAEGCQHKMSVPNIVNIYY